MQTKRNQTDGKTFTGTNDNENDRIKKLLSDDVAHLIDEKPHLSDEIIRWVNNDDVKSDHKDETWTSLTHADASASINVSYEDQYQDDDCDTLFSWGGNSFLQKLRLDELSFGRMRAKILQDDSRTVQSTPPNWIETMSSDGCCSTFTGTVSKIGASMAGNYERSDQEKRFIHHQAKNDSDKSKRSNADLFAECKMKSNAAFDATSCEKEGERSISDTSRSLKIFFCILLIFVTIITLTIQMPTLIISIRNNRSLLSSEDKMTDILEELRTRISQLEKNLIEEKEKKIAVDETDNSKNELDESSFSDDYENQFSDSEECGISHQYPNAKTIGLVNCWFQAQLYINVGECSSTAMRNFKLTAIGLKESLTTGVSRVRTSIGKSISSIDDEADDMMRLTRRKFEPLRISMQNAMLKYYFSNKSFFHEATKRNEEKMDAKYLSEAFKNISNGEVTYCPESQDGHCNTTLSEYTYVTNEYGWQLTSSVISNAAFVIVDSTVGVINKAASTIRGLSRRLLGDNVAARVKQMQSFSRIFSTQIINSVYFNPICFAGTAAARNETASYSIKEEVKETLQVIDGSSTSPNTSENKTRDSDQAGKSGDALIAHIAEEWHNYFASMTYEFAVHFYEETISYSKSVLR